MLSKGKKDLIMDMWRKQLRTGKTKITDTRTYGTLFSSSKVGKAGLTHTKPSSGRSHR